MYFKYGSPENYTSYESNNIFYGDGDRSYPVDYSNNGLQLLGEINEVPNKAGIYLFFHKPSMEYRYIGSSNNIRERIKTHLEMSKKYTNGNKELYFDFFQYPKNYQIQCYITENRLHIEYSLIDLEKPKFNILGNEKSQNKFRNDIN